MNEVFTRSGCLTRQIFTVHTFNLYVALTRRGFRCRNTFLFVTLETLNFLLGFSLAGFVRTGLLTGTTLLVEQLTCFSSSLFYVFKDIILSRHTIFGKFSVRYSRGVELSPDIFITG